MEHKLRASRGPHMLSFLLTEPCRVGGFTAKFPVGEATHA